MSASGSAHTASDHRSSRRSASAKAATGSGGSASQRASTWSRSAVKRWNSRSGSARQRRCRSSCRHHGDRASNRSVGSGPRSSGWSTCTGLNSPVQGAAVAVHQWRMASVPRSATHDAVVCDAAASPPACMHGADIAPVIGEYRGRGPPWSRRIDIRSPAVVAWSAARLGECSTDPTAGEVGPHTLRAPVCELGDGEAVADRSGAGRHVLDCPLASGGLEHERLARVGHDVAVVVGEVAVLVTAAATLAVALQQIGDHGDRSRCGRGSFEGEAEQVHPGQPERLSGSAGEHGLVADHDTVLVGAHLGAEHPERPAQQHGVGLGRLLDLDPGAAHSRAGRVRASRLPLQQLRLVGIAVGILREQHSARSHDDHRVAHAAHRSGTTAGVSGAPDRPPALDEDDRAEPGTTHGVRRSSAFVGVDRYVEGGQVPTAGEPVGDPSSTGGTLADRRGRLTSTERRCGPRISTRLRG